ncbi:hypothetical protein SJI00_20605 [Pseudomonas sp. RP23018S]|uniref:hypothetical protein n=1 Tax=Pseudomonas sp. RP23018S TaxID=3096037 RepID=UPI002ACAA601|nr:hypothetical protein [Pseudomonas sp. RP23018S]MDZ5605176.1 hypothetical protein [Pseudomonas sp. RP23018S]
MANESDCVNENPASAPFNSERIQDVVLDHVLDNVSLFMGGGSSAERITLLMDSLQELSEKIALGAMANRVHLSDLPTFNGKISADTNQTVNDDQLYETRFRIVEQRGDNPKPIRDEVLSKAQAIESYGKEFVESYWGSLGERCPNSVTTGDRTLWFSIVRYPVNDQSMAQGNDVNSKKSYRAPSLR